jgi:inosine-uridine nucleoside N-ribohydrolase
MHGKLPWQGAFAPENKTYEAEGNDPTSGNPNRIVKAAFKEGFPRGKPDNSTSAANFMVEMVRKYPGQVSIYSAGALTNVALAVRLDPQFASLTKELVIMGGYVDVNMLQVTGSMMLAELQGDVR